MRPIPPSAGTVLAHDYFGGLAGVYESAAINGFNEIAGPRPTNGFPAFETNNFALFPTVEDSWVTVPALNLNSDTVSFTMWIHPYGGQADYAGLFMTRSSGTIAGVGYGGSLSENSGELVYTWNGNTTWTFNSGLMIPAGGQWSFVAVVIDPNTATLYLYNTNGLRSATNAIAHATEGWNGRARIGGDPHGTERTYTGVIDEVAIFNYALTPAQVLGLYSGQSGVTLGIQRSGPNLILSWTQGTLQQANSVTGAWSTVSGAAPPSYSATPTGGQKFYRVRVSP